MIQEENFEHILAKKYMRTELMPHAFCSGCGIGIIERMILMAFEELGEEEWRRTVFVSGIGCSGWTPLYFRSDVAHTLHGRAIPFATAVKLARPELNVIVIMGDGDALAIGGNHLIHAARRNIGLTTIVVTNMVYSLTGGQMAPTTPEGAITQTTPYGNIEPNFDLIELMKAAGATYLARWTTYHIIQAKNSIKKAIKHRGFSLVEIVSQCPTFMGRYVLNKSDSRDIMQWFKENSIPLSVASSKSPEELRGKIIVGEFLHKPDVMEYTERLKILRERLGRK